MHHYRSSKRAPLRTKSVSQPVSTSSIVAAFVLSACTQSTTMGNSVGSVQTAGNGGGGMVVGAGGGGTAGAASHSGGGTVSIPGSTGGATLGSGGTGGGAPVSSAGAGGGLGSAGMGGATGFGGMATTGGSFTGGQAAGGAAAGGQAAGGEGVGGQAAGGGGETSGGGTSSDPGNYPIGNPPVLSAACGTPTNVTTGERTINSTNQDRVYYVDVPDDYDENTPYRFFYISHWIGSRYQDMVSNNFYGLKTLADAAGEPAIFVAPSSDGQTWQEKDHALFDDLLAFAKENFCIDTSRVFATGFSFGGMITYSLSTNHQQDIRAAVGIAPANYNIWLPEKTREPIAWMQTTGMADGTCPWVQSGSSTNGAKFLGQEKAEDNGCTAAEVPTWQSGAHVCYDYEGCDENHPTKICTFDGGHQAEATDPGTNGNWIPEVSWDFFTQF